MTRHARDAGILPLLERGGRAERAVNREERRYVHVVDQPLVTVIISILYAPGGMCVVV